MARPSATELREIYEVRAVLEKEAAQRVAKRCSPEDIEDLRAILEQQRQALDPRDFARSNAEFHDRVFAIAGQRTLSELITGLRNRSEIYIRLLAGMPPSRDRAFRQHVAIVEALEEHNSKAVVRAMTDHLASTVSAVSSLMKIEGENYDGH